MRQDTLHPTPGSKHTHKRVGFGNSSGHGNYCGRGKNGQKARQGHGPRPGFEGGQLPIIKRLPQKRGFVNIFRIEYALINLDRLSIFESGTEVTAQSLLAAGLIRSLAQPIKVLGDGELKQPLVIKANKFSAAAKAKIEAAGGKAEEVGLASEAK